MGGIGNIFAGAVVWADQRPDSGSVPRTFARAHSKIAQEIFDHASIHALMIGPVVDSVNRASDSFAVTTQSALEHEMKTSQLARMTVATAQGVSLLVPGICLAAKYDAQHLPTTATKLAVAAGTGVVLRVVLPKAGAAKMLIAATLGLPACQDLINPFRNTYHDTIHSRSLAEVNHAGNELGRSLGRFTMDTIIGMCAGSRSEALTEKSLGATLGYKNYLKLECGKQEFWDSLPFNNLLSKPASYMHATTRQLSTLRNCCDRIHLTIDEKLSLIEKAGSLANKSMEDEGFYKYGPRSAAGERIDLSDYLDQLLGNTNRLAGRPQAISSSTINVVDDFVTQFSANNMSALAEVARKCQEQYTATAVQLADIKENLKAPIFSISDATRHGALLDTRYSNSTKQLCDLITEIRKKADLTEAGFVLDLHAKSATQDELRLNSVRQLNLFAAELHDIFVNGLKKAGVSTRVLSGSLPSRVTITNDRGAGNFTIPHIPGVIDRPVTIVPRNQQELLSVLAGINRHEMIGHDHVYGDLAGFPTELRNIVLPNAVKEAMQAERIADTSINVPGIGPLKKSEFFLKILQAQSNENTSDLIGTATGGADSALTLGLLLQSLRRDGQLETRSVLSSRYEDQIEPHGIDRSRIKWCAEQMRQLAPNDPLILKQAQALDVYASTVARPDKYYTWASEDEPGQSVAVPVKEWDSLIPHIVKSQLNTPVQSLEGKRLKDILPDLHHIVTNIETLATLMEDAVHSNSNTLAGVFNPAQFSIGQVYAAGLRTWMRAAAHGIDPEAALTKISRISGALRNTYLSKDADRDHFPAVTVGKLAGSLTSIMDKPGATRVKLARFYSSLAPAQMYILTGDMMEKRQRFPVAM